jgi:hypothetical protein
MIRVAVDAMGGDRGPEEVVAGALDAASDTVQPVIVGPRDVETQGLELIEAPDVIAMDEKPTDAVRAKPNSSLVVACRAVGEGKADAVVSAGNTGAMLAASLLAIRRIPGVGPPPRAGTKPPRRGGFVRGCAGGPTPGIRRISSSEAASIAPVLPAETTASAFPSPTERQATTSELFGLVRTESVGFSSIAIRSGASISSSPWVSTSRGPTMTGWTVSEAASTAPATTSSGPRSPPMASTATRIIGLRSGSAERLDVAAAIGVARRADPVRALGPAALRTDVQPRRLDLVLRSALVAAGLGSFLLWDGHRNAGV